MQALALPAAVPPPPVVRPMPRRPRGCAAGRGRGGPSRPREEGGCPGDGAARARAGGTQCAGEGMPHLGLRRAPVAQPNGSRRLWASGSGSPRRSRGGPAGRPAHGRRSGPARWPRRWRSSGSFRSPSTRVSRCRLARIFARRSSGPRRFRTDATGPCHGLVFRLRTRLPRLRVFSEGVGQGLAARRERHRQQPPLQHVDQVPAEVSAGPPRCERERR